MPLSCEVPGRQLFTVLCFWNGLLQCSCACVALHPLMKVFFFLLQGTDTLFALCQCISGAVLQNDL